LRADVGKLIDMSEVAIRKLFYMSKADVRNLKGMSEADVRKLIGMNKADVCVRLMLEIGWHGVVSRRYTKKSSANLVNSKRSFFKKKAIRWKIKL
jgi:hypothetical protein